MAKRARKTSALPVSAHFDGRCSLDIPDAPVRVPLENYPLRCRIEFSPSRDAVTLLGFDPLTTADYEAPLGPVTVTNRTTVLLKSAKRGTLSPDGHFAIPVVLRFDHLFDAPFYEEDSDLALTLTTRARGGAPMNAKGEAVLVGEGTFSDGALHRKRCTLTYRGRVSPMPW